MGAETEIRVLYVPCGSEAAARDLVVALLERRLIACANIYPSRSIYRWKGSVADEVEHVVFAKTTSAHAREAAALAEALHSYEIPCVLVLNPASANEPYEAWVAGELAPAQAAEAGG